MTETLVIAATAAVAALLYLTAGVLVLHWIFRTRRIPRTGPGRAAIFVVMQLVVLPTLDVVDGIANHGCWNLVVNLLPTGLEPLEREKA